MPEPKPDAIDGGRPVRNAALFLVSRESGFITGTTVSVDGGAVSSARIWVEK